MKVASELRKGVLFLTLCIASSAAYAAEDALLRLGVPDSLGGVYERMGEAFAEKVSQATRGSVRVVVAADRKFNTATPGILGDSEVDLAWVESCRLAESVPALSFLTRPMLFADPVQARQFYQGAGGKRVAELAERRGIVVAGWIETVPQGLLAGKALEAPNDFRSLKIFAADPRPPELQALRILGAGAAPDAAEADAELTTPLSLDMEKVEAGNKHFTIMNFHIPFIAVIHSSTMMGRIPENARADFAKGLRDGIAAAGDVYFDANYEASNTLADAGFQFSVANIEKMREKINAALPEAVAAETDAGLADAFQSVSGSGVFF